MGLTVFLLHSLTKAGGEADHSHWIILGDYNKMGDGHGSVSVSCLFCVLKSRQQMFQSYMSLKHIVLWLQVMDLAKECADGRIFAGYKEGQCSAVFPTGL